MPDSLGDRMKQNYENRARYYLTRRTPVIVRVDGRAFHSLPLKKPFDWKFVDAMILGALHVAGDMQGFKMGYVQSDEASFVMTDYDDLQTQGWFNYNKAKIESITASGMTAAVGRGLRLMGIKNLAMFDARAFNIPESEVANYFLWRAMDWSHNSISMYAQSFFSHQELHKKSCADMHEMLHNIGCNWSTDLMDFTKNGIFIVGQSVRTDIEPSFDNINKLWESMKP
jgi:tRNA(His) 5'-end guanylyltransferase